MGFPGVGDIGVVHDRRAGTVSATVAVAGRHFGLVDRADQDAAVSRWGTALAGFVRDRSPVCQVRWSEWAAPAGVAEHLAFLERACHDPAAPAAAAYRELVEGAGRLATRHETLVTMSVALGRPGRGARAGRDARAAAIATLGGELRLFSERLTGGGLRVSAPWTVAQLARAVRSRLDPTALGSLDRRSSSLGQAAGGSSGRPTAVRWPPKRSGRGGGRTARFTAASMWRTGPAWPCRPTGCRRCWCGTTPSARSR